MNTSNGCESYHSCIALFILHFSLFALHCLIASVLLDLLDMLFEEFDPLSELPDYLVLGVHAVQDVVHHWHVVLDAVTVLYHNTAWYAHNGTVRMNILIYDGVGAYPAVVA